MRMTMRAPHHPHEAERIAALQETGLLDAAADPLHEAVVALAAELCGTPYAAISLIDIDRQWVAASTGLGCKETPRDVAFCAHTILGSDPLVVNNAVSDPRFADNTFVTEAPGIRFYAGVPLTTASNLPLGALCVIDTHARNLSPRQLKNLQTLAGFVSAQLELCRRTSQLQTHQQYVRMLVDHASDYAMITLTQEGLVTSWNVGAQRINGYTADEAIGERYSRLFTPEDQAAGRPEQLIADAIRTSHTEFHGWRVHKSGSRFHVFGSLRAVLDDHGHCKALVQVSRDDTEAWLTAQQLQRRTAELADANARLVAQAVDLEARTKELVVASRAAEAANKSKSEFLANMSHEIRTPMTAILGFAELLASEDDHQLTRSARLDYVNTIQRNGQHLLAIINDILDLSKIEADKLVVDLTEVRPVDMVREVHELMAVKARGKGLVCEAVFETPVPEVIESDPVRLRQILVNLVGNALKFTEIGGVTMRVSFDQVARLMRFEITDTGIGLSPAQQGTLFGAFTQADASTTRKFGGTGLGLHLSKRLATMLGGDVTVLSTLGTGSTFTATISIGRAPLGRMVTPAEVVTVVTSRRDATPSTPSKPLDAVRILLAEDGPDNQRLIAFHLRKAGAEVQIVENGCLVIQALTQSGTLDAPLLNPLPFDLLVTDMQMPEMDGYAATRLLRSKGCTLPIVALTAHAMRGDEAKCLAVGCNVYVSKPIDRARLISACADALGTRQQRSNVDPARADHLHQDQQRPQPTVKPTG